MSPLFPPQPMTPIDLDALRFRAETNPGGPAIDLVWELPNPATAVDMLKLRVLRRMRRFPGMSRRGVVAVVATADDLGEGDVVYDSAAVDWDLEETREEVLPDRRIATTRQYHYRGAPRDRALVRTIRRELPREGGPAVRTVVRFVDRADLEVGTIYYYTAFAGAPLRFSARTQSSALATGPGGPELFPLLPRIHQQRDTEAPPPFAVANAEQGRGQLERLLRTVQVHGDMLTGFADGLRDVHDPRRVDARLLQPMAELIGWELKAYLTEEGRRNEIVFANEVYRTLGTKPNIAAMVNRLTGWTADVKEFARNVVVSWDSTRVERLQGGGTAYLDGSASADGVPPVLSTRKVPAGSVDTADPNAMFRLRNRTFEDETAFTYDCGQPDPAGGYVRDDTTWYNRETLGVYATPDVATEPFALQQTWERVRAILSEFLPIQVRAVLFIRPGVVNETPYVATTEVAEDVATSATLLQDEIYSAIVEDTKDKIPQWRWLVTNQLTSRSLNTAVLPVDLSQRTRHVGIEAGP